MNLRLAGFGWVLSLFLKGGEEVLCTGKGQHGRFQGTTMAFAYTQNVRLVNKNLLRFKLGTCPIKVYNITNKSASLLTGLRNHTSEDCMSLYFPTQNLR